jgi:hypothetical protein
MAINAEKLRKPGAGKGAPPAATATTTNLSKPPSGAKVPLQLKLDPDVKRDFNVYAVEHDIDMSDLFVDVWRYYKENHG